MKKTKVNKGGFKKGHKPWNKGVKSPSKSQAKRMEVLRPVPPQPEPMLPPTELAPEPNEAKEPGIIERFFAWLLK